MHNNIRFRDYDIVLIVILTALAARGLFINDIICIVVAMAGLAVYVAKLVAINHEKTKIRKGVRQ